MLYVSTLVWGGCGVAKARVDRLSALAELDGATTAGHGMDVLVAIGQRIKLAAERIGTKTDAAKAIGVTPNQLWRWIGGENEPSITPMMLLARKANVSLDWLLMGKGPTPLVESAVDESRLANVILTLEDQLQRAHRTLSPAKKAEAVVLLYELSKSGTADPTLWEPHVARVLKLVD